MGISGGDFSIVFEVREFIELFSWFAHNREEILGHLKDVRPETPLIGRGAVVHRILINIV
jgi:hypothetical protein